MIALLPLFFGPAEPLGGDSALANDCARRAASALREAMALCGEDGPLVAALPDGADDAPARLAEADHILRTGGGPATPMCGVPPGFGRCMGALRALARTLPGGHDDVVCLDPRATLVTPGLLARAARRFRAGAHPLLVSALPPQDHPCQGKRLYGALHAFARLEEGPRTAMENGRFIVTVEAPGMPGPLALDLRPPGDILRIFQDPESSPGTVRFTTPLDAPPPLATRWRLLSPQRETHDHVLLPALPAGAPWRWDAATARVVNAQSGRALAGRQDFPRVLEPDGSLCVSSLAPMGSGEPAPWPDAVDVVEIPEGMAVRVTNQLEVLRWLLLARTTA